MDYSTIVKKQNDFFNRNETKSIPFRVAQLKRLKAVLQQEEANLYTAIYADFKKSEADTYATELSFIYDELDLAIKNDFVPIIKRLTELEKTPTATATATQKSAFDVSPP